MEVNLNSKQSALIDRGVRLLGVWLTDFWNSRRTSQRGARHLAHERKGRLVTPKETLDAIGDAIREKKWPNADKLRNAISVAAAKWNDPLFDHRYPFEDRLCIAFQAVLLNIDKIQDADDPGALAYTIAFRMLGKLYREETAKNKRDEDERDENKRDEVFLREESYTSKPIGKNGKESQIDEEVGASGTTFRPSGSPGIDSAAVADENEQSIQEKMEAAAPALPEAMSQLTPIECDIVKHFFGYGADLTLEAIAKLRQLPTSTTYFHRKNALTKLRKFYGIKTERAA